MLTELPANPNEGILEASFASAISTVGVFPLTPEIYTASPIFKATSAFAVNFVAPRISPIISAVTELNSTSALVATSCPMAISSAFTVTPVPAPTAISLVEVISPPPVKPAPAVIDTPE